MLHDWKFYPWPGVEFLVFSCFIEIKIVYYLQLLKQVFLPTYFIYRSNSITLDYPECFELNMNS